MKKKNLRTLGLIVLNFVILFGVYQVLLKLESLVGTVLYLLAAGALAVAYYVINRGFGSPTEDASALPADWSPVKKEEYLESRRAAHERAKKLLYWLLPLILVLGIDFIYLFLGDTLRALFSV